jgi:hypothetical protein
VGFVVDKVLWFPIPPTAPHSSSIIWGWYNRPINGRLTKWSQSHHTPRKVTECYVCSPGISREPPQHARSLLHGQLQGAGVAQNWHTQLSAHLVLRPHLQQTARIIREWLRTKPSLIRTNWGQKSSGLVKRKVALNDKKHRTQINGKYCIMV